MGAACIIRTTYCQPKVHVASRTQVSAGMIKGQSQLFRGIDLGSLDEFASGAVWHQGF